MYISENWMELTSHFIVHMHLFFIIHWVIRLPFLSFSSSSAEHLDIIYAVIMVQLDSEPTSEM